MNVRFPTQALTSVACDVLVVGAGPDLNGALSELDEAFDGKLVPALRSRKFSGAAGTSFSLPTFGRIAAATLVVVGLGDASDGALRRAAARAGRDARALRAENVALHLGDLSAALHLSLIESAAAGNYAWQAYKPEKERTAAAESWLVFGASTPSENEAGPCTVRARWQDFARDLVNMSAADLYPESLAARARELESIPGVEIEIWDFERCRAEGCVGVVAVGQASDKPGCILFVRYRPPNATQHIAFVGKGVTFDSGGLSLKPSGSMQTMRCDMGGAATVLAATGAIAELGLPVAVDCIVGAVENMVSGDSYKLGDVLTYNNGVTVEIHNTDAEGRLVLADCLLLAGKVPGVSTIIDAATLTGAAVVALGPDFSGLFTSDDGLANSLLASAEANGEGLWRLPLHGPYNDMLKSDYAQIKNVGGRAAGSTTAALFLQHFVASDGPAWAHIDIAGPAFMDKANSRYAAGGTGEMVRSLATWAEGL